MKLLSWQNDYSIGNETIDNDHKALFQLINEFYDAFIELRKRSDLRIILIQLVQYAEEHFQREERFMEQHAYPETERHHQIHNAMYETIFELNRRLESDPLPMDREAVIFLKHWLTDHILQEDKKVQAFMAGEKGDR